MDYCATKFHAGSRLALIVMLLLGAVGCAGLTSSSPARQGRSVVLISIDGLRPDFYLDDQFQAPHLKRLKSSGAYSEGALPVYPSSTFPNHATIATGARPARHGVVSNTLFDPVKGPSILWFWDAYRLKVPAIWDVAKQAGKTVAIFGWPVSVGAAADWIVPEIFSPYGIDHDANWQLTLRETDPAFMAELQKVTGAPKIKSSDDYDHWMTDAAIHVLRQNSPDLTLLHFRSLDEVQHSFGPDSERTRAAVARVDAQLGRVLEAINLKTTLVIVVGDHGFDTIHKELNLNAWFREAKFLNEKNGKILDWTALAHMNGNQAAIYAKDRSLEPKIIDSLRRLERTHGLKLTIFNHDDLARMGAFPKAICAVDPPDGYGMGTALTGPVVRKLQGRHGTHGALANRAGLRTGLILVGPGVPRGLALPEVDLLTIAPTIAREMEISMKTEGNPLELTRAP